MSTAQNTIDIQAIQQELQNTKKMNELTASERRQVLDALAPNGMKFNINNDDLLQEGDSVYGVKTGINNGKYFEGYIAVGAALPPVDDTDIDFTYQVF